MERAAALNLESASDGVQHAADLPHPPKGRETPALRAFEAAGGNSIRLADARRAAIQESIGRTEAMDEQLNTSLDGAWKIFGRVLARQSLMQLRTELADVRRGK